MRNYKTVFLGDGGVGKTAIIRRVSTGSFQSDIAPTIGASFIPVLQDSSDGVVKFQVWDTAGQEKYHDLVPLYSRNAVVALVVFDITSAQSFRSVEGWISTLRAVSPDCLIAVIGNKCDQSARREISVEDGEAIVKSLRGMFYAETSALTGEGIEPLFPRLVELVAERAQPVMEPAGVPIEAEPAAAGGWNCC
jgi:small GTP-binding protein